MAAFHLLMEGDADFKPMKGFENALHVIGEVKHPLMIMKKKDIPKLFTDEFWYVYSLWIPFHAGLGFPDGRPYGEQDPDLVRLLIDIENHWKTYFDPLTRRLDAIINCLKVGFRLK